MEVNFSPYPLTKVSFEGFEFTIPDQSTYLLLTQAYYLRNANLHLNRHGGFLLDCAQAVRLAVYDDNRNLFWPLGDPVVESRDATTAWDSVKKKEPVLSDPDFKKEVESYFKNPSSLVPLGTPLLRDPDGGFWTFPQDDPAFQLFNPIPEFAPRNQAWERESKKFREEHPNCLVCGSKVDCQVHHKYPFHLYPDREMDPKYWRTLCRVHHLLVGHGMNWANFNPHVDEDIEYLNKMIEKCQKNIPES